MNYPYFGGYMPPYQAQAQTLETDGRIWVQNETAAEAYLVTAGGFVRLWDSTKPVFYEKRADATGRPLPIVAYKYEKCTIEPTLSDGGTSELKAKFDALEARILALEERSANYAELTEEPAAVNTEL